MCEGPSSIRIGATLKEPAETECATKQLSTNIAARIAVLNLWLQTIISATHHARRTGILLNT
jgi:hypothetical protein